MSRCTFTALPTRGSRPLQVPARRARHGRNPGARRDGSGLAAERRVGRLCRAARRRARLMIIEINGMAHVILTVSRFEVARDFYRRLLPEFGMKVVHDGDKLFYCV